MKVAVVTGGNKGIGFEIVKLLCKQFDGTVYLTARNESLGMEAISSVNKAVGVTPGFHKLDITNRDSLTIFSQYLQDKYGGLDLLVNNAGIAYKQNSTAPFHEQAEFTVATNFFGVKQTCDILFPLLKSGARVVHLGSSVSSMIWPKLSQEKRSTVLSVNSISSLCDLALEYVESCSKGKNVEDGWAESAYSVSKVFVRRLCELQQREMEELHGGKDIVINSCCPGYCVTDMTSGKGFQSAEEGADTPVYLAFLPKGTEIRGKFVSERKVADWPVIH